jgi:dihydrofolate reductase
MTRTLVWTGFVSLDGVADSPGGTVEGHRSGGWVLNTPFDPEAFSLKGEELADTGALMFGRRSYEAFATFWPASADHAAYRDLPKYIVSSTLGDDDVVDGWGPQRVLRSLDEVAAVKREEGGSIYVHGSPELARALSEAGLVDRYNLLVFPVLLGAGKSVFSRADVEGQRLSLVDSAAYGNGVVKVVYDVQH